MAKKKVVKKKTEKSYVPQFEDALPQNIVPFGEHVEEDKNIYISQSAYKEIHRFTKDKTTNESGVITTTANAILFFRTAYLCKRNICFLCICETNHRCGQCL